MPSGVVLDELPFFCIWTDTTTSGHIFTMHQVQLWGLPHLQSSGWYIECPKDKTPSSEKNLRLTIQKSISSVQTNQSTDDDVVVLGDTFDTIGIEDVSIQSSQQIFKDVSNMPIKQAQSSRKHARDVPTKEPLFTEPPTKTRRTQASTKHSPSTSTFFHRHATAPRPSLISRDHNILVSELVLNDTVASMQKIFKSTKQWPSTYHEMSSFLDKVTFIYILS